MKQYYAILCFVLVALISSCSIEKRVHQPGFYIDFNNTAKVNSNRLESLKVKNLASQNQQTYHNESSSVANDILVTAGINEPLLVSNEPEFIFNKKVKTGNECDLIIFRNGDELLVKVSEVLPEEIKYKRCDNLNGPTYTAKKLDVFMVKYANGTKDVFLSQQQSNKDDKTKPQNPDVQKQTQLDSRNLEPIGLVGFFLGVLGLFLAGGIVLGITAMIMGVVSLGRIRKMPDRFSGAGFAAFALILGIISLVGAIVLVGSL